MSEQRKIVRNADNEHVMPWGDNNIVIGYVDVVNGNGAEEIADFVPTRHELLLLVKHWYGLLLDNHWFWFVYQSTGSTEIRENSFAENRIHRIAELLGDDAVNATIADVKTEFSKQVDPDEWEIFLRGDDAQREAVAEKYNQQIDDFHAEIEKAEQEINQTLGYGTEAAANMITFLHHYRHGRSISSILANPIDPKATANDKQLAEKLLQILEAKDS